MDQPHGVVEAKGPGKDKRGVFAERESGGERRRFEWLGIPTPEHLERGKAGHEDRRLAHGGGVEPLGRAAAADREQVVTEESFCPGEEFGRGRLGFDPVAGHADHLGPLAGKEDRRRAATESLDQGTIPQS